MKQAIILDSIDIHTAISDFLQNNGVDLTDKLIEFKNDDLIEVLINPETSEETLSEEEVPKKRKRRTKLEMQEANRQTEIMENEISDNEKVESGPVSEADTDDSTSNENKSLFDV